MQEQKRKEKCYRYRGGRGGGKEGDTIKASENKQGEQTSGFYREKRVDDSEWKHKRK